MSDVRALLRAKRQHSDARITHPYAAYNAAGQLRCAACGVPVKSAAMWEGHVGSKAHRVAVRNAKAREEEAERVGMRRMGKGMVGKRKAEGDVEMDVDGEGEDSAKKRRTSPSDEPQTDGAHPAPASTKHTGFPADFFSDPFQAPILSISYEDEDEADQTTAPVPAPVPTSAPKSQLDIEWEQFQASLLAPTSANEEEEDSRRAAFAHATVAAEPELIPSVAQGFPPDVVGSTNGVVEEEKKEETEEEKRKRKQQEERELIMDRLVEEERAQEEADERVGLLRARVEALKKAREARRKGKHDS